MTRPPISQQYAVALHAIAAAGHDIADAIRAHQAARPRALAAGGWLDPRPPRAETEGTECVVPGTSIRNHEANDSMPDGSKAMLTVTKAVRQEELADALAQHYGAHENLAAVPEQSMRQNYLSDARSILNLLGGGTR
jgi:hypothetical protein